MSTDLSPPQYLVIPSGVDHYCHLRAGGFNAENLGGPSGIEAPLPRPACASASIFAPILILTFVSPGDTRAPPNVGRGSG